MTEVTARISTAITLLEPVFDQEAAVLLSLCPAFNDADQAAAAISDARNDGRSTLLGLIVDDRLTGAYILTSVSMSNEIRFLAIAEDAQRRGHGKMCLYDALFRSGKRPLVVDADESNLGFFKACGFKLVGKRKAADGSPRFRLGWHAPIPVPGEPGKVIC